jgi:hypothetical protein
VNGFHVHAVGWILTANALALRPAEAREVSDLWTDLVRARAEDLRRAHPLVRLLVPRSLPLSLSTRQALATLVERMAVQHPERFGAEALRQRRNHWARQAALGVLFTVLAATLLPKTWPLADTVAPAFFLMACGCLLPALTLWRAAAAVHSCSTHCGGMTPDSNLIGLDMAVTSNSTSPVASSSASCAPPGPRVRANGVARAGQNPSQW